MTSTYCMLKQYCTVSTIDASKVESRYSVLEHSCYQRD